MTSNDILSALVEANHILAMQGVLDAFGHISCRSPERDDRFIISRSMAPALVTLNDLVELDLDGRCASDPSARLFLERYIHSELYRARPDVMAIVHSHAPPVIPFTVVPGVSLKPIFHMCGFLRGTPAPFDASKYLHADCDLLIRNPSLGSALASHIGGAAVVLMRGHGYTAVGGSVPQATYRAIYCARNCAVVSSAVALGEPIYLTDNEAIACDRAATSQLDRAWDLWRRELQDR